MAARNNHNPRISPQLDELSCDLMGEALNRLAEGHAVNVLLAIADAKGSVGTYEFSDDGEEACLLGARERVRAIKRSGGDGSFDLAAPCMYAICYEGAVADGTDDYGDAIIMEFGEKGSPAYSAYSYFDGRGSGDDFVWSDPAPAGEVENLL